MTRHLVNATEEMRDQLVRIQRNAAESARKGRNVWTVLIRTERGWRVLLRCDYIHIKEATFRRRCNGRSYVQGYVGGKRRPTFRHVIFPKMVYSGTGQVVDSVPQASITPNGIHAFD